MNERERHMRVLEIGEEVSEIVDKFSSICDQKDTGVIMTAVLAFMFLVLADQPEERAKKFGTRLHKDFDMMLQGAKDMARQTAN